MFKFTTQELSRDGNSVRTASVATKALSHIFTLPLRKGNARPAPGPDRWEKWFIKALSDTSLSLVLDLLNYEITHSHFPDAVKPSTISTIIKRGSPFDLVNYRGVCCSNFLLSTPFHLA
jgi:hypothetical protein